MIPDLASAIEWFEPNYKRLRHNVLVVSRCSIASLATARKQTNAMPERFNPVLWAFFRVFTRALDNCTGSSRYACSGSGAARALASIPAMHAVESSSIVYRDLNE